MPGLAASTACRKRLLQPFWQTFVCGTITALGAETRSIRGHLESRAGVLAEELEAFVQEICLDFLSESTQDGRRGLGAKAVRGRVEECRFQTPAGKLLDLVDRSACLRFEEGKMGLRTSGLPLGSYRRPRFVRR